jgi:partner of Y14 and mago protein
VRKQLKIRPGYTPQEDVRRFRGTKQAQMDANTLPKGHIIGWTPPPSKEADPAKPMSKSAKKNAKRREKKTDDKKNDEPVKDNWEDEDEAPETNGSPAESKSKDLTSAEALTSKMEKLDVR